MENNMEDIARQLRKPMGSQGQEISQRMNDSNSNMVNKTIDSLNIQLGQSIVEIGAGNGITSRPVLETIGKHGKYIAIDYSKDMLKLVDKNLKGMGFYNFEIIHGDCTKIDAELVKEPDGIFACNLLYFIDDLTKFVQHVKSWLPSKAKMSFSVRSKETMEQFPFTKFNFNIRTINDYIKEFNAAGVDVEINVFNDEGKAIDGKIVKTDFYILHAKL
ncbi:MAG: class I SAM-dependent methyltransferase [Francisellaceae bacterium]|nr:class I SAM-dependent methyltransferase [Francisellaceae bacterium]